MIGTKWMSKHKAHTVSRNPGTHPWMHSNSRHNTPPCPFLSTQGGVKGPDQRGAVKHTVLHLLPPTRRLTGCSPRERTCELDSPLVAWLNRSVGDKETALGGGGIFLPALAECERLLRSLRRGSRSAAREPVWSGVNLTNANSEQPNKRVRVEITRRALTSSSC